MTEPFISPWLIYLVQVIGNLGPTLALASFALGASRVIPDLIRADRSDEWEKFTRTIKLWLAIVIFCCSIASFIPSKETATAILIASKATPDNYDFIKKEILGIIDKVKDKE